MKNKPTKQHYVPQCYLREWVDPNTPSGQEPYVWIFNRGEKKGRRKAPSNIFVEKDLYTLKLKSGDKSYVIEEALSELEGRYATIFRDKIKNHLPLTEDEHVILCAFAAVMLQRTLRHKDSIERFYDEMIERTVAVEQANGLKSDESDRLRRLKQDTHKKGVVQLLPDMTELLMKMSIAFLCAEGGSKFVTSDDPASLFNPDLQWQRFYGAGLAQQNVQLTLPLSPNILLCMSWSPMRGYIGWEKERVEEANRMVVGHCYQYFISHSPKTRRHWYRSYPLDFFFILKIIGHKISMGFYRIKRWYEYDRHVRKK